MTPEIEIRDGVLYSPQAGRSVRVDAIWLVSASNTLVFICGPGGVDVAICRTQTADEANVIAAQITQAMRDGNGR